MLYYGITLKVNVNILILQADNKSAFFFCFMNIIVFGGAGFIGTNLIDFLLKRGDKVICLDNFETGDPKNIKRFNDNFNFKLHLFDITYGKIGEKYIHTWITKFFDGKLDEIYNLACPASPLNYMKSPLDTIRASLAVDWICGLAQKYDAKLLQASTSEVYGDAVIHPQTEDYYGNVNPVGPRSCYDEGKRIAETILYEYNKLGVKCKIVRIFNTYGPYMARSDGRVIPNFINQALSNSDITIYGDGSQTRSFQYIDDLIYGMTEFMKLDEFGPINLGNPNEIPIHKLADLVLELIPKSKSTITYKEFQKDDPIRRKPDITKAYNMFGYSPKIDLREGLIKTIKYYDTL